MTCTSICGEIEDGSCRSPRMGPSMFQREQTDDDAALFRHFLVARRAARGPLVCVNDRFFFPNAAATQLIGERSRDTVWRLAQDSLREEVRGLRLVVVSETELGMRTTPVLDGDWLVGAEIRLVGPSASGSRAARDDRHEGGWGSLSDSERALAIHVASGLSNRDVAARLYMSRFTVDYHLRHIYQKLGISSRVELTRLVVEHDRDAALNL